MAQVTWTSTNNGAWANGANWSGGAAPLGSDDAVIAAATSGLVTIAGPGSAANLTTLDLTALDGSFTTGNLTIGDTATAASLQLDAGSTMTASMANVTNGSLVLSDPTTSAVVSGPMVVGSQQGSPSASVQVTTGTMQVGLLALVQAQATVSVGQAGSLEVGSTGGAASGALTVDSGSVMGGFGAVSTPSLIDNGEVIAQGGTLTVNGAVMGSGALVIGTNGTLALQNGAGGVQTLFTDTTGALALAESVNGTLAAGGAIAGFAAGDQIDVAGSAAVTSVSYTALSANSGALSLMSGSSIVGTLSLAGAYGSSTFHVAADPQLGSVITATTAADPLFDTAYYLAHNPDVAAAGVDAYQHYLAFGAREGRNPDAFFDSNYYLTANPDVRAAGVNPLQHYETFGWHEGRNPSLLFNDSQYLSSNPDVVAAGIDPLQHYLQYGQAEGRAVGLVGGSGVADPLVDPGFYDAQLGATLIPGGAAGAQQAQSSYDNGGWQQGLNPDAYFNTTYYLAHNPDVAAAHIDPLLHYEMFGWREGRDPSASFSTNQYLAANADVTSAGMNPLLHFVTFGQAEGRTAFHV